MAKTLGITVQRLNELARSGALPKVGRGDFDLAATVQAYLSFRLDGEEKRQSNVSADRLRDLRASEVEQRVAEKARQLVSMDEAMGVFDQVAGLYVESIGGLPARLTRDEGERQRIEGVCDQERQRLSDRFGKLGRVLRTGIDADEADEEADA